VRAQYETCRSEIRDQLIAAREGFNSTPDGDIDASEFWRKLKVSKRLH